MEIESDIKSLLQEHFEKAYKEYIDYIRSKPEENSYFSITGEDFNEEEFNKIRDYFLQKIGSENLSLSEFNFGTKSIPPTTDEQLFSRAYESLLKWAAYAQHFGGKESSADKLVNIFEKKIGSKPKRVTYIPIFGLHRSPHFYPKSAIVLSDEIKFGIFTSVEHELVRIELGKFGSHSKSPNPARIMPQFFLKIENNADNKPDTKKNYKIVQSFRVLLFALFGADIEIQYHFSGFETCMSLWTYSGGRMPHVFENFRLFHQIGQSEFDIFEKYWIQTPLKTLNNYSVTANRLNLLKRRQNWADTIIDLAIAMEALFETDNELKFRYSVTLASILGKNFEEKDEIFKKIREFYDLRSVIVHGGKLERQKSLKKKFDSMTKEKFDAEMKFIKNCVLKFLRILILNKSLQDSRGQVQQILGKNETIVFEPTYP